jgi:thiol-disulfide isomerase/thioredoxin
MRLLVGAFLLTVMVGCDQDPPLPPGLGDSIADHEFRVIASPGHQFQIGSEVSLRSFRGSPLVIDFWASWCTACLKTHGLMKELAAVTTVPFAGLASR